MKAEELLSRLDGVRPTRRGYMARCPAHDDRHPSLSISDGDKGVLIKCWAGCEVSAVVSAIGLRFTDLFYDAVPVLGRRVERKGTAIDRVALAFNYEMMALDYQLRSSSFFRQAEGIDIHGLAENDLDRLIDQVGAAHFNVESARRLERIADFLRLTAFNLNQMRAACRLNRVA